MSAPAKVVGPEGWEHCFSRLCQARGSRPRWARAAAQLRHCAHGVVPGLLLSSQACAEFLISPQACAEFLVCVTSWISLMVFPSGSCRNLDSHRISWISWIPSCRFCERCPF
jgi:hypothetical protein